MKDYIGQIDLIEMRATNAVDQVLRDIQKELIQPFCDKYRLKFWSGMGGYNFITRGKKDLLDSAARDNPSGKGYHVEIYVKRPYRKTQCGKELEEILKVLEHVCILCNATCAIGAYLTDYDATQQSKG
jgi:hypothetical protein